MKQRLYEVTNENNLYFERRGHLIYENVHDLMLRIDCDEYSENVIFDKSEVTELV